MTDSRSVALVGAAGGVGTTRLCVEAGALVAAAGHDVLVLDADYAAQGLASHVDDRLDPDATALATDPDVALADAAHDVETPGDGTLSLAPADAPFTRLAAASTAESAERIGDRIASATDAYDYVLVDTPPVATNPAVAAVTAADTVAVVTAGDGRGADALARVRDRLADVGASATTVVATRTTDAADADVTVPTADLGAPGDAPAIDPATPDAFARSLAALCEHVLDLTTLADAGDDGLLAGVRSRLP
ncbi:MAG: ParA family protein [Halarchaeum sp.]